jgi:hypothetical protein
MGFSRIAGISDFNLAEEDAVAMRFITLMRL